MSEVRGQVAEHLVALGDGWTAWRCIVLRSAGFPASIVLQFAATETSAAIGRLIELEAATERAREAAVHDCLLALARTPDDQRKPLGRLLSRIRSGQRPDRAVGDALGTLHDACDRCDAQSREIEQLFQDDSRRSVRALRELAGDPVFREALVWQNRALIASAIEPMLTAPLDVRNARTRRRQAIVASYAQRYCTKNDTIGFFGPVGWARLVDHHHVVQLRPGATLVDVRNVQFEYWCIDVLAAKLADDPELMAELAPDHMPTIRIDGATVHYPIGRSTELAPDYLAVLGACDGQRSARTIARELSSDPALGVSGDEVYDMLTELVELRLIRWTLEVSTAGLYPERYLRRALERLPSGNARDRALHTLGELEAGRDAVARAAGDAVALDHALRAFEDQFSALTDAAATRRAGETYAARTLLYEDTRRNVEVELGTGFVDKLGPPLTLVMLSARWYTHAVASAYRPIFRRVYHQLRDQTGDAVVDYVQYLEQMVPHFAGQFEVAPTVRPIIDQLHATWLELLGVFPHHMRPIERDSATLFERVRAAFAAPAPGWPEARYHSPDLMVAAADFDAFARGAFFCVVSEIHVGLHSYVQPLFMNLHPDPDSLIRARDLDLGRPSIKPVETRANVLRTGCFPPAPGDIDIETSDARSWRARQQVIPIAQLVVEAIDERLLVRTRDGRRSFDIIEVFEMHLQLATSSHFSLLPPLTHTPRVSIDRLVVARETWHFAEADLSFARSSGLDRFIGARRWAQHNALPRFVFVRVPHERKPCFVDLESPVYVENLSRLVQNVGTLAVSEMLPALDQTWLMDAARRTYCSELRIAVVDPERWRPDGT